jgi:hypothetical protein
VICIWSLVLVVTGPVLQPGLMQKGIQHAAIQTVMCFAGWTRGWGRLAMSYQHHHWIGGRPHTCRTPALKEMVLDMVAQNPCRSTRGSAQECGCRTSCCPFNPPGWISILLFMGSRSHASWLSSLSPILRVAFTGTWTWAFWSTSYGQMKQHSHVKVSSTVTTATCGHSIIPM